MAGIETIGARQFYLPRDCDPKSKQGLEVQRRSACCEILMLPDEDQCPGCGQAALAVESK